ncbi:MAG: TlpA disulfide reductase family protein [Nitrospiria bacterium]
MDGPLEIKNLILLVLFPLVLLVETGCTDRKGLPEKENTPLKMGVEVGLLAPDFSIENLKGGATSLTDYRGKVVLINFWATWCGPCKAEMPSMEALYRAYGRGDFEILAVSIDLGSDAPVRAFVEDFGFTFPILLDNQFTVNDQFQVRVVPTSILIDRSGVVTHRLLGAKDWNDPDARMFVEELIKASSRKARETGAVSTGSVSSVSDVKTNG